MRFFLDNNLSPRLARAIKELDSQHEVVHLREMFNADVDDTTWMSHLSKVHHSEDNRWVIVTGDTRILRNPANRHAWKSSGLTTFFLHKSVMTLGRWDIAWRLVRWWPLIAQRAEIEPAGAAILIDKECADAAKGMRPLL